MCVDLTISLLKLSQMNLLVFKGVTHWKVYELNFYIQAISRFSFELMFFSYRSLSAFSAYSSRPSSGPALPPLINSSLQKYRPTFGTFGHQSSARNMMFRSFNQVGLLLGGLSGWRGRACGTPVNWPIYLVILLHQSGVFYKNFHFSSRVQLEEKFHIFARQCVIISINFSIECLT